jgi:hypothetical protein
MAHFDEEGMRSCLGDPCQIIGKKFLSKGFGNRFCPECDKKRKARSSRDMFFSSRGGRVHTRTPEL